MNWTDMDQLFKNKLDQYESEVPRSAWQGIDARLTEEQNKTRPYLWIVLITLVLLTLGYLFYVDFFEQNETEPVEMKDNAIASVQTHPASYRVNYYQKEDNDVFFHHQNEGSADHFPSLPSMQQVRLDDLLTTINDDATSTVPGEFKPQQQTMISRLGFSGSPRTIAKTENADLFDIKWPGTDDHCYSASNHYFFAELSTGLDFPFQKLGIQEFASDAMPYLEQRSASEQGFVSFNTGLMAGYIHPSGLLVKTGIQYAQLNETFNFVKQNIEKIQTQITIDTMFMPDGSFVIHKDTTTTEIMKEEKFATRNRFRMIDLPLIFGYRFAGSNFGIEINTGLIFNIMNFSSGRIFNESLEPSYYGTKSEGSFSPFKTQIGLSFYAGIRYMTGFYGKTQFYIEPNLRYYFNSFSQKEYPISQKYLVTGVTTGMKYFF